MKRTFILQVLMLGLPTLALAQAQPVGSTPAQEPRVKQVYELCDQVDAIIQDINLEYAKYINDTAHYKKLYKNSIARTITFYKLKKEVKDTRKKIKTTNESIEKIKEEIKWVDTLNGYYTSHQLDPLFEAIDGSTLQVYKRLLGNDAPKSVHDLLIMQDCVDLLKREYNEKANEDCLRLLKGVADCDTKEELEGLLQTHSAIVSETNGWSSAEHTLYELMDFRKYLREEYGVDLEKNYPFLADKARKSVKFGK